MKNQNAPVACAGCGRRDFIYGLLAAVAAGKASAHELGDFFAALPAPTPAGTIPDKTGAVKVRLVFAIWDDVQVRKTWPNVGFDFRPVMKNIADALFENLTLHYRGKENAENIAWYYAQALYKEKDYYSAGYQFKRFARQFPYSEHTEEAAFLSAYCKYLESPAYSLDQSLTREAIEEFQTFADRWPRSLHIPEVNRYLDEMNEKLMKKEYEIAYGYYFIEEYRAAYERLKYFLNLYPEAPMREDAMFYLLRSGYRYAIGSREDKQQERLQTVLADFERYSGSLSDPKHLAEAQDIYTHARAALTALDTQRNNQ